MNEATNTTDRRTVPIEKMGAGSLRRLLFLSLRRADGDGLSEFQRSECYALADRYHGELVRRGYTRWSTSADEAVK